ncbi:MAG: hypothetical protein QNK37_14825 [Acidobacteriota bacterium]|nr:hypothetical protein [Acidobacteriota bacterium]
MNLDANTAAFRRGLHQAADKRADLCDELDQQKLIHGAGSKKSAGYFNAQHPMKGVDPAQLIDEPDEEVTA